MLETNSRHDHRKQNELGQNLNSLTSSENAHLWRKAPLSLLRTFPTENNHYPHIFFFCTWYCFSYSPYSPTLFFFSSIIPTRLFISNFLLVLSSLCYFDIFFLYFMCDHRKIHTCVRTKIHNHTKNVATQKKKYNR